MAEYIEREAVLADELTYCLPYSVGKAAGRVVVFAEDIEAIPAADVAPVVHGRWIAVKDFGGGHCVGFCDKCRTIHTASSATALKLEYRFCRWCGARMDGAE